MAPIEGAYFAITVLQIESAPMTPIKWVFRGHHRLAFTLAPHLQPINHRGCFSPFVGI
jgi:hypothetical protein